MPEAPAEPPSRNALMRLGGGLQVGTVLRHPNSETYRLVIARVEPSHIGYCSQIYLDGEWRQSHTFTTSAWQDLVNMGWEIET